MRKQGGDSVSVVGNIHKTAMAGRSSIFCEHHFIQCLRAETWQFTCTEFGRNEFISAEDDF
jgi:hypothetical protein